MNWKTFISDLTGDSTSKVSQAEHDARDDSGVRQGNDPIPDKAPDWADRTPVGGVDIFPAGK